MDGGRQDRRRYAHARRGTIADAGRGAQFYTLGSAWFTFDDDTRGSLKAGKLADLAVLTKDYLTAPTSEIGRIESVLTMVGGRIVYAAGPYARLEEKPR